MATLVMRHGNTAESTVEAQVTVYINCSKASVQKKQKNEFIEFFWIKLANYLSSRFCEVSQDSAVPKNVCINALQNAHVQCRRYDHNFLPFSTIFCEKNVVFL
jgi:hypothetical protein